MKTLHELAPHDVWKFFDLVCSIPHPSGSEAALADKLSQVAIENDLTVSRDAAGNLRIQRPAAAGLETRPAVLLQAHMDMVPLADDPGFDFRTTPVTPYVEGDWIRARGTTLGADNGIGVALAMAALCDKNLKCGPLAAIFTVDEEVGLTGAAALDAEMLAGKYLINLDGGPDGDACIGCAGGARMEFIFVPEFKTAAGIPVEITLSGMRGGHSGICIHEKRGNAVKALADFLLEHPEFEIAAFNAGGADNAIPGEGRVCGCFPGNIEELSRCAELYAVLLRKELDVADLKLDVAPAQTEISQVWQPEFQRRVLSALSLVPNGVLEMDDDLQIVRTSSNLAAVFSGDERVTVRTSQRSLDDEQREHCSAMLSAHFESFGASAQIGNCYPGWKPMPESRLTRLCADIWERFAGTAMTLRAIHAGLETGAFSKKNPELELISIGPEAHGCHTPQEHLSVSSTIRFYDYLLQVISALD